MVVIADTSPLNYLVLIGEIELLHRLFDEIFVPAHWASNLPAWVRPVVDVPNRSYPDLETLGQGERAALDRQIPVAGILGILELASAQSWISLPEVIAKLQRTNFWIRPDLLESLIARDRRRKKES